MVLYGGLTEAVGLIKKQSQIATWPKGLLQVQKGLLTFYFWISPGV